MKNIKVAAATAKILCDDSMVIAGGILPKYASGQEGKIRVSAIVIEGNTKLCIVSCDIFMIQRDILDEVCRRLETEVGIPFENILITSTHTHHAPSTVTVHGYSRDTLFCKRVKNSILSAVHTATNRLKDAEETEMYFWLGEESTVGQNSRLLMKDRTIYWPGHWTPDRHREDALRPTGPFDPELPVMAFKQGDGSVKAFLFNHSTHNIKARESGKRSPGFYGLTAQKLEEELGGTAIFLPGAAGSTHNLESLSTGDTTSSIDEMILRIENAIKKALSFAKPKEIPCTKSVKKEIEYQVRKFDEEKEDKAVCHYCNKRLNDPEPTVEVFRKMRRELSRHQGQVRKTWLQVMLLGNIALVGIPGEIFAELGIQIKRLSPFRYTYIVGLANDYIGYVPDKEAFELGGYQIWTGFHSFVAKGTGEMMVKEAVQLLSELEHSQRSTKNEGKN